MRSKIVVGLATAAMFVLGSGTASAGTDVTVYSQNFAGYNLAKGTFKSYGDSITVCDLNPDGYRAIATVEWSGGMLKASDTDGDNGSCATDTSPNIPEGTRVHVEVWIQDGANGDRMRVAQSDSGVA